MARNRSTTLESDAVSEVVRAGGGLVVRRAGDGRMQVAIVHRPDHQDWSFPKGKLEEGETFEEGALREVLEETGLTCRLGRFLGHTQYRDRKDRPKVVAYWVMTVDGSTRFTPDEEVDELRWADFSTAGRLLSYERDRDLLATFAASDDAASLLP